MQRVPTYNPTYNAALLKLETDPVSGTTFALDAFDKPYMNIHAREGAPLPDNPLALKSPGKNTWGAGDGVLTAIPGGAWALWNQGTTDDVGSEAVAQLVDTAGQPKHSAFLPSRYPVGSQNPTYPTPVAVVPGEGEKAWFLVSSLIDGPRWHVYIYPYDGASFGEPIQFMELAANDEGGQSGDVLVIGGPDDPWLALPDINCRVVHVVPGCVYKSFLRMEEEDAGAGGAKP